VQLEQLHAGLVADVGQLLADQCLQLLEGFGAGSLGRRAFPQAAGPSPARKSSRRALAPAALRSPLVRSITGTSATGARHHELVARRGVAVGIRGEPEVPARVEPERRRHSAAAESASLSSNQRANRTRSA
jgi:hypothetical protein